MTQEPRIQTAEPPERARAIPTLFEAQVVQHPDRIILKSQTQQLTRAELNRAANRLARAILDRRGLGSEPIVLLMNQDVSVIVAILAVLKAGKFYVSLDSQAPEARLKAILDDVRANLLLADSANFSRAQKLSNRAETVFNVDAVHSGSDENLNLPLSPEDLFGIFYTSGSTGSPKGIVDYQARHLRSSWRQADKSIAPPDERIGLLGSAGFAGYRADIVRSFVHGAGLYLYDVGREGLGNLGDWLMHEEITTITFMASVFRYFARSLETRPDLSFPKLRLINLGGEPTLRRDVELYKKYFPDTCQLRVSFASTEAGMISAYVINKETAIQGNLVPVGFSVGDKQISIMDDAGNPVGFEQVGEIAVKSRYLPRGYWRQPELTQTTFLSDPGGSGVQTFYTGDLGRMRADGLLEYLGRKDEQVKIRGHRVEMAEVEMALLEAPGIRDACVAARDVREEDQQLVAYVIADPQATPSVSEIRTGLAKKLPDYMIPTAVVYLDAFPLLPNGKIDRRALPAPERRERNLAPPPQAPRDRYELELVRIWQDLLGIQPIGTTDNFFDLGGHSLLAARLLVEIEKRYGQKFPPRILLQASTVAQLAQLLYDEGWKPTWSPVVPIHANGTRPPLFYIPPFNAVFGFYQLDALLDRDQPVYGLLASPGGDEFPFTRVEDEAAYYLSQIKTIQPHGPYYLAGWSSGGLVALETAQRLIRAGQTVAFLGLFDTVVRSRDLRSQVEYSACRLKYFWRLGPRQLLSRMIARVRKYAAGHFDPGREERRAEILGEIQRRPDYSAIADRIGYRGYVPQNYPGRVTLFLTATPALNPCIGPAKNWSRLAAGRVQVHAIPGVHNAIFEEPHVRPVIEKLQASLLQAQAASRNEPPLEKSS